MKDFVHGRSFKVLLTVIFVMFGLMLYTASTGSSFAADAMGLVATPMQRVSTIVTNNAVVAAEPVMRSKEELIDENAALKKKIEELNAKLVHYDQYRMENAQLRKYLELKDENRDFKPVPAAVIGRDPNVLYKFTIDKGTGDGVSINDPVITDAGVVGFISAVNSNYSQVTTILSPDTKIAALVTTTEEEKPEAGGETGTDSAGQTGAEPAFRRDSGVVGTDIRMADNGLVKLGFLAADTPAKAGDVVTTSGLGGVYPSGLAIGEVVSVKNEEYDVSLYAEIKPFVDVNNVRDVMVITEFDGQGQALEEAFGVSSDETEGQ
ncbi:rod shape-determining protein MreC [Clostridium sp. D33t1_170424_F3]|uniref:rod shape-determining protein MreC n=1 Tax=Clostridium sp. D33t1_170424_F3 TaxID=2787099 RepID=UPI0018AC8909|nr:rod shape-determining protein MreC [Clostridium sp. D33t1_170424_F3]